MCSRTVYLKSQIKKNSLWYDAFKYLWNGNVLDLSREKLLWKNDFGNHCIAGCHLHKKRFLSHVWFCFCLWLNITDWPFGNNVILIFQSWFFSILLKSVKVCLLRWNVKKTWFLKTSFNFTGDLITSHSSFWGLDINGVKKIQFDSALLY